MCRPKVVLRTILSSTCRVPEKIYEGDWQSLTSKLFLTLNLRLICRTFLFHQDLKYVKNPQVIFNNI